jgi:putative phosphoesterase
VDIGLLSDTHVPARMRALPPVLFERLAGVDLLLHAGDLDDPSILDQLRQIAPVHAVRGNVHFQAPRPNDQGLPLYLDLEIESHRILLTHGHLSLWNTLREKVWLFLPDTPGRANRSIIRRLLRAFPGKDVYVFGHSHRAMTERQAGSLFINPGAVCPTRGEVASVARLTVTVSRVIARILPLYADPD